MNYNEILHTLIKNTTIWGENFNTINKINIIKAKKELRIIPPIDLNRILLMIEDIKIDRKHDYIVNIQAVTIALAISSIFISFDKIIGILTFFIYIFFILKILRDMNKYKAPNDIIFNNKLKCLEISIIEILSIEKITQKEYDNEIKDFYNEKQISRLKKLKKQIKSLSESSIKIIDDFTQIL